MSRVCSISTGKPFRVVRLCREWGIPPLDGLCAPSQRRTAGTAARPAGGRHG